MEGEQSSQTSQQIWLKVNGVVFICLPFLAYYVKVGLTWHDAGAPLTISDLKFHPYYNMIIMLYFVMGPYLIFQVSPDPSKHKVLLSYLIYGMCFAHGIIATLAVFAHFEPMGYYGPSVFGDIPETWHGLNNWDKLLLACPTWFTLGFINLFFAKKDLDSFLLPWQVVTATAGETPPLSSQQIWLKIFGPVLMGIVCVAYGMKFGVTWHDAGAPFTISDIKFHPYYNMIIILYTVVGFYALQLSADPSQGKSLLSFIIYGMGFGHALIATIAVFAHFEPMGYFGPSVFGDIPETWLGLNNWDKLLTAIPTWSTIGFGNLFFAKKDLGSYLLPWDELQAQSYKQLPKDAIKSEAQRESTGDATPRAS